MLALTLMSSVIVGGLGSGPLSGFSLYSSPIEDVDRLRFAAERCRQWLMNTALPFWWMCGANIVHGGYHDRLGHQGRPDDVPQRLRVQARQTFVYAEAGRLGWDGPWRAAVDHGLAAVMGPHRRADGYYRASVSADRRSASEEVDLYDQAFVLLCLAAAWREKGQPPGLREAAEQLVCLLRSDLGHPMLGFEEAWPRRLPLRANPHMHLLEAALVWVELGMGEPFTSLAADMVALAASYLIDPDTGAIGEFFDGNWNFAAGKAGRIREPGHQFEWAFLLNRHSRLTGTDLQDQVRRLYRFGEDFGVEHGRVLATVDAEGGPVDRSSRLWAQTERLRAVLSVGLDAGLASVKEAIDAVVALDQFIADPRSGLWYDCCTADGLPIVDTSPASSFYHIVTALAVLIDGHCDDHTTKLQ